MRTFPALALGVALTLVTTSPATAQTAVAGLVLDIAAEIRDLVFATEDLEAVASDLDVQETETEIRIELAADVLFDFDSANLHFGGGIFLHEFYALNSINRRRKNN